MRKRNIQKIVRFSRDEAQDLQKKAKKACLSEAGLIRLLLRGYEPREKPDERFYDVMRELSSIGNNINQLAVKANALGFVDAPQLKKEAERWHTLVYYDHRTEGSKKGCYFNVNTTKTPAGMRQVPMLEFVKEAFLMEKERQELLGLHCEATVDGYTDFIFVNRFGQPQHQATLNKAIRRIIRNCNDKQFLESENPEVLLPHFSCHSLRHTFTTRMCEAGVNVKVIQDALGHKDVSTTLNIYTDVTKELRKSEFEGLELQFNQ